MTATRQGTVMAANFEILQPRPGEFRWVLMSQGRVLARSEAYTRRVSCQNAIESFRQAAVAAVVDDQTVDRPVDRTRVVSTAGPRLQITSTVRTPMPRNVWTLTWSGNAFATSRARR